MTGPTQLLSPDHFRITGALSLLIVLVKSTDSINSNDILDYKNHAALPKMRLRNAVDLTVVKRKYLEKKRKRYTHK